MFATYHIVRVVIIVVPLIVLMVLLIKRAKKRPPALVIAGLVLLIFALGELSSFVPFENIIVKFNTPEHVFKYAKGGEVLTVLEGSESALIMYEHNERCSVWIPYKEPDGWKIPQQFSSGEVYNTYLLTDSDYRYSISMQHLKNTDDYYVIVQGRSDTGPAPVTDSRNSTFECIQYELHDDADLERENRIITAPPNGQANVEPTTYIYLSYLHGFDGEYILSVDGEPVHITELQPVRGLFG